MTIHVVITLNITLDRSVAAENRSAIIDRLTELIVEGAASEWLSIRSNDGPNMVQIYRYVVRCSTSESKPTRELFERMLTPALRSLAVTVEINHEASACISMELGEYYFMNSDFEQAAVHLKHAKTFLTQGDKSKQPPESDVDKDCCKQTEGLYPDPEKRISVSRLEALLRATHPYETASLPDDSPESLAIQLLDPSTSCSSSSSVIIRSLWDFLYQSIPIDLDAVAQNGVDFEQFVLIADQTADALSRMDLTGSVFPPFPVERLRMWIEQARVTGLSSSQNMAIESNPPPIIVSEQSFNSCHSRTDLIELIEFYFKRESGSSIPIASISGKGYDDVVSCAAMIEQKNPEQLLRLLLDSEQSEIAERFARSSPTTSFSVAALLSLAANNLPHSPLTIGLNLFGGIFADVATKRLLSRLKIPNTVLLPKLLKCLLGMLVSSIGVPSDTVAHFKAIAKVLYALSDFRNCARVLLTITRLAYDESFLSGPVLTDPIYYEMFITSLTEIGETFDAAVLCQCDNFLDLEKGSRLLMTSPRRLQSEMFSYILYPELVEALVYAYDRISPDNNKKQAALNLMSRPIMMAKRNHPQRTRYLEKFITGMLSKPKYSFLDHTALIAQN